MISSSRLISEILASKSPTFSTEFFPPKDKKGSTQVLKAAQVLKETLAPDFVSITYGAGGSTRDYTLRYAEELKDEYGFEVMPHLTCVGHSKSELLETVQQFQEVGFRNIMTLRGDPPQDKEHFRPHPQGLSYASELVALIQKKFPDFCLGVAGYPETHPEAPNKKVDIENLRHKVNQGASFITTQLFYDNNHYFDFVKRCRSIGITIPILPGILPILSFQQVKRFCKLCGASIPTALETKLEAVKEESEKVRQIGTDWAYQQVKELIKKGVPGIHFYILNRPQSTLTIIERLKAEGIVDPTIDTESKGEPSAEMEISQPQGSKQDLL